jgi:hypothetical protein
MLRYSVLAQYHTLQDRFDYLKLRGVVGEATFGFERHINQEFYSSRQWRQVRNHVIDRDRGCDLGVSGWDIHGGLYIHHMNPMTVQQIVDGDPDILNPDFLITVTHKTHNAIHYGNEKLLSKALINRVPGDTKLW